MAVGRPNQTHGPGKSSRHLGAKSATSQKKLQCATEIGVEALSFAFWRGRVEATQVTMRGSERARGCDRSAHYAVVPCAVQRQWFEALDQMSGGDRRMSGSFCNAYSLGRTVMLGSRNSDHQRRSSPSLWRFIRAARFIRGLIVSRGSQARRLGRDSRGRVVR
jgi:hypothetical protein